MNELTFNMDGPSVLGAWINPKTGDAFIARDNFIQDNQFIVVTTDNRQLNLNFIQDYIKLEKKPNETDDQAIANFKKNFGLKQNKLVSDIPDDIMKMLEPPIQPNQLNESQSDVTDYSDLMIPEDANMFNKQPISTNDKPKLEPIIPEKNSLSGIDGNKLDTEDLLFIKRALKSSDKPNISVGIDWKHYPQKKIDILTNILGVDIDNIVDWFIKDINIDELKNSLKQTISDYIKNIQDASDESDTINTQNINPKPRPELKLNRAKRGRKANTI